MTYFSRILRTSSFPTTLLLMLITSSEVFAQAPQGPPSPSVDGTSPLLGYLIAIVLLILAVLVSILPSKRHFEDI